MTRIVSVDGNIGSGKSTFVERLKTHYSDENNCGGLKICFLQEPVDIWNTITDEEGKTMIECFYANPLKYAFAFQMMAYISRLSIIRQELKKDYDIIFTERCIYTDRNVFAKMLYDDGKINEVEFKIYNKWFDEFVDDFPSIEYVYIQTDPQVALDRIIKRGRLGENIPIDYLTKCHDYHDKWLSEITDKIIIDGNIDTGTNPGIISEWINRIDNYVQIPILTFDGASRGNPGPSGIGWVICKNKKIVEQGNHFIGKSQTNNYAEYCALLAGLRNCNRLKINDVIVKGDSLLVINQMKKIYMVSSPELSQLYELVKLEIDKMNYVQFVHIPRNKNQVADQLANLAINKWGKEPLTEEYPIIDGMELT